MRAFWLAIGLIGLWIIFESAISWAAFCHPDNYQAASNQTYEEYCAFRGPLISGIGWVWRDLVLILHNRDKEIVAAFTIVLALSTIFLWISTRDTAQLAKKAFVVLERPYVAIDVLSSGKLEKNVSVRIVNHGRSIAFTGVMQADFFVQNAPPAQFRPKPSHDKGVHWVIPGNGKGQTAEMPHKKEGAEIDAILSGQNKLYFIGVISYRDGGGKWYETGCCSVFNPQTMSWGIDGDATHNFMT